MLLMFFKVCFGIKDIFTKFAFSFLSSAVTIIVLVLDQSYIGLVVFITIITRDAAAYIMHSIDMNFNSVFVTK